tara:strand:+ start:8829 stop:9125 length:297 start_codon:yes stop_codon:yes gene_type:complete
MICLCNYIKVSFSQFSSDVYFVPTRIFMRNGLLLVSFLILGLSACSASKTEEDGVKQQFGEKCENAKQQLDKAVEEGQLSDLRVLKRDIELYCVWRRN